MKSKAEDKILLFPGSFDVDSVRRCRTIGEFDEAFICKVYGFQDKVDYYRKTGSKWWLDKIRVPTVGKEGSLYWEVLVPYVYVCTL